MESGPYQALRQVVRDRRRLLLAPDVIERISLLDLEFVSSIDVSCRCQLCKNVAREPYVTIECGHLFCITCICTYIDRDGRCPEDFRPLTRSGLRKDIRTAREIGALRVKCPSTRRRDDTSSPSSDRCTWVGCLSDLQTHLASCERVRCACPFSPHGCSATPPRSAVDHHITSAAADHSVLLGRSILSMADDVHILTEEVRVLSRESPTFVWVIPNFKERRETVYSRKFHYGGLPWYLGLDFDRDHNAGVYLFADNHTNRVRFVLRLFNADPSRDKGHSVGDWAESFRGKGWGPLRFIIQKHLDDGFLVGGSVRIGCTMEGEPFA